MEVAFCRMSRKTAKELSRNFARVRYNAAMTGIEQSAAEK